MPFAFERLRLAIAGCAACLVTLAATAQSWQSPASIRAAAETHALAQLAGKTDARVDSVSVDDRLKLPRCDRALVAASSQPVVNGRGTVIVSCTGSSPWRLFVPVRARHTVSVIVARRAIRSDEVIDAGAITLEARPSTSLPYQYLSTAEAVVGFEARRAIMPGTVIVPAALRRPTVIERGSIVMLQASRGGVAVSAEGTALEDGIVGQRIRIKTPVGRVVEGVVASRNLVQVGG